jgi:hypothetical protein
MSDIVVFSQPMDGGAMAQTAAISISVLEGVTELFETE